mmetsp:Transcript_53174/g.108475  ORF Transcript_53174/g.108475 Transcript_53174/m.108475 type:complete len:633 (-) Transcript_53174:426-2324(-)
MHSTSRSLFSLVFLASISLSLAVETGRWRYGSISWSRAEATSRRVTIHVESAWRLSHQSIVVAGTQDPVTQVGQVFKVLATDGQDPLFNYDGGEITARFDVEVVRIDPSQDLVVGKSEFDWEYSGDGPYTAELTLCCRVAENQNANRGVKISTMVDLSGGSLGSPAITMIPRVNLDASSGVTKKFLVPAAPRLGMMDPLTWSLHDSYWGVLFGTRPNATMVQGIVSHTGVISIDITSYRDGWKEDMQMLVQVAQGGSTSMVDFIVHVQPPAGNVPHLTLIAPPAPHPLAAATTDEVLGLEPAVAFEGFPISFSVRGEDADLNDHVFFEFTSLPSGLAPQPRFENNPSTQVLRWTPMTEHVGKHWVCAVAVDIDPSAPCAACTPANGETSCVPSCPEQRRSSPLCLLLDVMANNPPTFALPAVTDRHIRVEMNQLLVLVVLAEDANWVDQVSLKASNAHPMGSAVVRTPGEPGRVTFTWRPGPRFGGFDQQVCFEASDSGVGGGAVQSSEMCLRIEVYSCRWLVDRGDSLSSIAAHFGSNYVQMWSLNPGMESPDDSLRPGDSVNVGHLYKVRETDNLRYLSVQFATTRGTLELLNYGAIDKELGDKDALTDLAGQYLCILPHSCAGYMPQVA